MCLAFIEMKPCFLDHLTKQSNFLFRYSICFLIILYMFWAFGYFEKRSEISSGKYLLLGYQIYRSVWFNYIQDTCMQKWENVLLHLTSATATNNHPHPFPTPLHFSFNHWRSFVFQTEILGKFVEINIFSRFFFFCLLFHCLAVRISLPFYILYNMLLYWSRSITGRSCNTVLNGFVAVDLLIFHILEGCPQATKEMLSLVP